MNASNRAFRTWAEIDLEALRHNAEAVRVQVGPKVQLMAVVKAHAYGHGAVEAVQALAPQVNAFGVANVTEAEEIQPHAQGAPIYILGTALAEERARIARGRFIPLISSAEEARAYAALAGDQPLPVHLKIDTGMGRMGVEENDALATAREIIAIPGVKLAGLASHLPVADEDDAFTHEQFEHFYQAVAAIRGLGMQPPIVHIENSAGIIAYPDLAGSLVRAGLMLYGSAPLPEFQSKLRAVMTWKTRITIVRDVPAGHGISYGRTFITPRPMRTATLAVGYADGYQRHLSNRGADVLIRGKRCPVLGRVTMDQIVADVSELPEVEAGEEVVLLGRQGTEEIFAAELAEKSGTIPWEIFTSVGRRVKRIHLDR